MTPTTKTHLAVVIAALIYHSSAPCQGQGTDWLTFEKCPVMVEYTVEIPAQERGILKSLAVELNQTVADQELLAELDTAVAELELRMAKLEQRHADELAEDEADVKYQQIALQKVQEELTSYRSISTSVSESEIRRLTLGVEQAKVALIRANHAQSRAKSQAELKAAAVEVAELRLIRRRVFAPRSGVITAVKIHPGQSVEAGQPILELQDLEHLIIDRLIPIQQVDVTRLVGAEVRVDVEQIDGPPVRLSGQITSYDRRVSSAGLVRVHARVKNLQRGSDWVLLPGREVTMYVSQPSIGTAQQSNTVVKPVNRNAP